MACEEQIDFMIAAPVVSVFNYLSCLPSIAGMKVKSVDRQRYVIYLSSSVSLMSWGENVAISFYDPLNGGTRIIITSKPKLATTVVDYGKNKKNVTTIYQYIISLYHG